MDEQYTIPDQSMEQYGKLVVTWAKDANSRPKDIAEFTKIVESLGGKVRAGTSTLVVIPGQMDQIILRLPPVALVTAMEKRVADPVQSYTLPAFYEDDVFKTNSKITSADIPAKTKLYHCRVADYILGQCG